MYEYNDGVFVKIVFVIVISFGFVRNGEPQHSTEKETRPEYIHPDGLLNFDPYLSDFKTEPEEDDYIPLPENDKTIDGLPIFLLEPKNSFVIKSKPAILLCRAANALQVFFKCNDVRTDKTVQFEHVDPQTGVRVVEVELNVTRNELEEYFGGKYSCECYAWNSKGRIRSQAVLVEYAYLKKQFTEQPQSATVEAGRSVSFRCGPPLGAPPATIRWTRHGVPLESTDPILVLSHVGLQDMANYTCVSENIAGRRESDAAVLTVYVNGGWSDWSPWEPCDCGDKGRRRYRSCSEPAAANGGAPCRGQDVQRDDDCRVCHSSEASWSPWGAWSPCSAECVRVRRRACAGGCAGGTLQHAACVDGMCSAGLRFYTHNTTLYIGVGVTVAVLLGVAVVAVVWCRHRQVRPGYIATRTGTPKPQGRNLNKGNSGPDVTRTCNEYWMQPDNPYDMPHIRNSYSTPFGSGARSASSTGTNHYEMKPYSPSGDSASSCYTNSRTATSQSSSLSPSAVDVAVTSVRDRICLTVLK